MNKNLKYSLLIASILTSFSFNSAFAQRGEKPFIDEVHQEMIDSPNIFDPEPYVNATDFKLADDAKTMLMDDGTARIPVVDDVEFPFFSEGITSSKFHPFEINDPNFEMGEIPVCIIGTDTLSKQWLEIRKNEMFDNKITCLVVEAQNENDINQLQKIAPKIFFNAMDGSWLQHIHVKHYPAIIFDNRVFQ